MTASRGSGVARRGLRTLIAVAVAAAAVMPGVKAQDARPSLEELLSRAADRELEFVDRFSSVVAEELYVQETTRPRRKRVLKSDMLLVRYPGASAWQMFRDVFEVDGKPVRDAQQADRMMKLFVEAPRDAVARANEIARAGARYNIWDIGTLNNPLIALIFLQPNYQPRFRFNLAGLEKDLGPNVRTVRFQEWKQPTILRSGANSDVLSRGLLWIDEASGRVVKTQLRIGPSSIPPEVVTTYAMDPSRPQREMERMAPEGHPGREVLTQILDRLKSRFPSPTDTTRTPR